MVTTQANQQTETLLSIRDLKTAFHGNVVHDHLDLDVKTGEVLVLLGGSGSGKSTLLRTLIGLEIPVHGTCNFKNENIFEHQEKQWKDTRKQIAYAFQGGALFDSLTVAENLDYPLYEHTDLPEVERRKQIEDMLKRFDLTGTEKLYPASLSGGMQKRVGLARAIMLDPALILYDEPTAGLDPTNSRKISETILALKKDGKTSILVTHDTVCALRVADRIAFIHKGRIGAEQSIEEVKNAPHPLIEAYLTGEDS